LLLTINNDNSMSTLIIKNLIASGFPEKEARIYTGLLELEYATVTEIAKHTHINRSSAYVILESLKRKGFVGISDDKSVRRYVAASPEIVLHAVRIKAKKQEEIKNNLESIIPELRALHKDTVGRPTVKFFEGKNGLINALEDTLNCKEKLIRITSDVEKIYSILPEYFPDYVRRRVKKKIKMHGIHPDGEGARHMMKHNVLDVPVIIPAKKYNLPAELVVYDNKIGYMSPLRGGFAVIIESPEMAEVMKSIFDMAWEEARRLNKGLRAA
jgi:HTH-type transcriptional regulator, sugar sensing transcriptional regulator